MPDVVSTGEAFSSTDALREHWTLTSEVAVGTALMNGTRSGVAYVPSGGMTGSKVVGEVTLSGYSIGGVGLDLLEVTASTDGSYEFPVAGALANTLNGTAVYATVAAGKVTGLSLTLTGNVAFGVVNNPQDYIPSAAGIACVKIGV